MGTGLIVAFVVTVWAAYFVPLALRRYDEAHNHSALEVLTPLSRVIRRAPAKNAAAVEDEDVAPTEASAPVAPRQVRATHPGFTRNAARVAARRRRRVLLTLVGANAVVGVLLGFSVVPAWAISIPVVLLVAWLVACRLQVRREYGLVSTPKPKAERESRIPRMSLKKVRLPKVARVARLGSSAAEDEDTVIVSGQFEDVDPDRKHIMENVPLEADALEEQLVIAVPSAASHGELVWDPLPVTLPTYVTNPRAGRTVRTIDFDAPGVWTSGHVEGEETEMPGVASESTSDDQRRAAGE